jgi:hypothetical protein
MKTIRLAGMCGLAVFFTIGVFASLLLASPKKLSTGDLAAIRGATPPDGCKTSNPQKGCNNPAGTQYSSTCIRCTTATAKKKWSQPAGTGGAIYTNPAEPCLAAEGTKFRNATFTLCAAPAEANNLICSTGQIDCTWRVACNSGAMQQDRGCASGAGQSFTCSINKPSTTANLPKNDPSGHTFEETWYSCRACTTGADKTDLPGPEKKNTGVCVAP